MHERCLGYDGGAFPGVRLLGTFISTSNIIVTGWFISLVQIAALSYFKFISKITQLGLPYKVRSKFMQSISHAVVESP